MEVYADRLAGGLRGVGVGVSEYVPWAPRFSGRANVAVTYLWRAIVYPRLAARRQGDVNHVIDHSYATLVGAIDPGRTVVTCHDVVPLAFGDPATRRGVSFRLWQLAFRRMRRAAAIICDSESTRRDLLRFAPEVAGRAHVIPNGVDHAVFRPRSIDEQRSVRGQYHLPDRPIVLHVGHCGARKNLETLLEAFAGVRARGRDAILVQAGGRFTPDQRARLEQHGLGDRVYQIPYVAAEHLPGLYCAATVLVVPSWYEGFGLPLLEGMAAGVPAVAADATSLPEVAGDAAVLVDPADAAAFADAIAALLADPARRADLAARARTRAATFTWERTARATAAIYDRVRNRD